MIGVASPFDRSAGIATAVRDLLARRGIVDPGADVTIACRPSIERSSVLLHDIDVTLDAGELLRLIAKGTGWSGVTPDARAAKPRLVADGSRERLAYEHLLPALDAGAPRHYGTVVDGYETTHLILERSRGVPIWQCERGEPWRVAARHLARLHIRGASSDVPASAVPLLRYDALLFGAWRARAVRFDSGPAHEIAAIARAHEQAAQWLLAQPHGVLHGEAYPSNVLIEHTDGAQAVRLIDWEMIALGPQILDLSYLMSGRWTDDQRADVVDAYRAEQLALGATPSSREHLRHTLDCGLLHLAVQNLGWSDAWSPPPQTAHDWRGEALRLSRKWPS